MIAVLFEAWPAAGQQEHYLDLAAALRADLDRIDGFLTIERFESLTEPGKLLSLSFWRDEAAVAAWRNTPAHRATQAAGRREVFSDYRLRIATVVRDYGMEDRDQAPPDSRAEHEPAMIRSLQRDPLPEASGHAEGFRRS
jgi:heme-degrading monooxygenase HmoA